jgi:hypothetical protein
MMFGSLERCSRWCSGCRLSAAGALTGGLRTPPGARGCGHGRHFGADYRRRYTILENALELGSASARHSEVLGVNIPSRLSGNTRLMLNALLVAPDREPSVAPRVYVPGVAIVRALKVAMPLIAIAVSMV